MGEFFTWRSIQTLKLAPPVSSDKATVDSRRASCTDFLYVSVGCVIESQYFLILSIAINVHDVQVHIERLLSQVRLSILITGNMHNEVRSNHS
jgi:hypothetical protein